MSRDGASDTESSGWTGTDYHCRRLVGAAAVVTGSSSGMGRAIALRLASEGARVICSDIRKAPNPAGYDEKPEVDTDDFIRLCGGEAEYLVVDVTKEDNVAALADFAVATYGRVDIWVNNAGMGGSGSIEEESLATFNMMNQVNLAGTWLGCQNAIRVMRAQDLGGRQSRGRIISLSSMAAVMGQGGLSKYAASKGGVIALTRDLAVEVGADSINVNALAPGFVQTALARRHWEDPEKMARIRAACPWPRLGVANDIAAAAAFLASDDAAWITGQTVVIDGGHSAA